MAAIVEVRRLERRGVVLEAFGIAYNLLEGALSIGAGVLAGSVALVGFGADSAIEVSASVVVLVHLLRRDGDRQAAWEGRLAVFVGFTMLALAAYVAGRAVYDLVTQSEPDESYLGIGIAAASVVAMPVLSRMKHDIAHKIGSRALEAESRETLVCSYLSAALLIGLAANAALGWWWADPVAALVMVGLITREGWEAVTRRELCCVD
ncbi:MAG TPA: cation transporter [Dehalococcoidia bacterium]|nr:cation transporter [Dehalococcoidia bacterium]